MAVEISGVTLEKAGMKDQDAFIKVFIDAYLKETGNSLDEKSMTLLNGWQHSLLAYHYFREEVLQGGFVQLIQNGYGSYIFKNPFAKALRIFGAEELSKIVYKAREIYIQNQKELERETTDDEFHAMYEQFEAFDELEERFFEIEEECSMAIAQYVDAHLEDFAEIDS
jgi:hypothetical protein